MPPSPTTKAPFYYVKKRPTSFFSSQTSPAYLWQADETGVVRDISFQLIESANLQWSSVDNPYAIKVKEMKLARQVVDNVPRNYFWQSKKAFISLDTFAELDSIGSWGQKSRFIRFILIELQRYIQSGYSVGLDFRQVFLVPVGDTPPAHFRLGVDVCVSDPFEYKKMTERLSYQAAKAIFNQFNPYLSPQRQAHDAFNQNILDHYAHGHGDVEINGRLDYTTPLKKYHFYTSALEAYINCRETPGREGRSPIIALTYPASVSELGHFFLACTPNNFNEITIVLKGQQYASVYERELAHDDILKLIKSTNCKARVHVFLISKDDVEENLLELRPTQLENDTDFQSLAKDVGYYLSSPKILGATYRNVQTSHINAETWCRSLHSTVEREKPKQLKPGAYILADAPSNNVRPSKTQTRGQLKANVKLAVSQQQSLAQNQAVNQQIQESQDVAVQAVTQYSYSSSLTASSSWELKFNLDHFSRKLAAEARKKLPALKIEEERLKASGFFTEFYLKNHSRVSFFENIANDEDFRLRVAAKVFGVCLVESGDEVDSLRIIQQPHFSPDNMEDYIAAFLAENIEGFRDGIFADSFDVSDSYIFGKSVYRLKNIYNYIERDNSYPSLLSKLFSLPSVHEDKIRDYSELNPCVLFDDDEIATIRRENRDELFASAKSLLGLFTPHQQLSEETIQKLERDYLDLVAFYFPDRVEEIARLKRFMGSFGEHNEDNLRILLQILIRKNKHGLDCFLKLLGFLEERALLDLFYNAHFKYALDCTSVEKLLDYPTHDRFLKLAARTTVAKSTQEHAYFERLCQHLYLFSAQHNLNLGNDSFVRFEFLWKRLYLKFMIYSGNQEEEAQHLLKLLAQHLMSEDGLSITPIAHIDTFFKGLEKLLDHAMEKHVLREQIDEIRGISFLPTDTAYACAWNGFKVISREMQIHADAINPNTRSYSVSNAELIDTLVQHQPGDEYLRTSVFRCLGTQSIRENLAFYRQLYKGLMDSAEHEDAKHIYELFFAFYVAKFTGDGYKRDVNAKAFVTEFNNLLRQRGVQTTLSLRQINVCTDEFFMQLQQIPTNEKSGEQNLWSIWRKHEVSAFTMAKTPIPEIFLRKFSYKQLGHFLMTQKEVLEGNLGSLKEDDELAIALVEEWSTELGIPKPYISIISSILETMYRPLNMKILLRDVNKITLVLHSFASLTHTNPESLLYLAMQHVMDRNSSIDAIVSLLDVLAKEMTKHAGQENKDKLLTQFLLALTIQPRLLLALPQTASLIKTLLETYLSIDPDEPPRHLITLMETLLPLGIEEAGQVFNALKPLMNSENGYNFLIAPPDLTATQLKEITQFMHIVKPFAFALELLEWYYQHEAHDQFADVLTFLQQKSETDARSLLILGREVCKTSQQSLLEVLQTIKDIPVKELKRLAQLCKLQVIRGEELQQLTAAPSLQEAISEFQQRKNQENLQRYDYDPEFVKSKIARIKLKSYEAEELLPLSPEQQELLWRDYQQLMSYMRETQFSISKDGVSKKVTVNELDDAEFALLFSALQKQIAKGINVEQNQLLLCALSVEALYQTTHKFPRCTQILTLLQQIHFAGNVIHEQKTGEGKSIVAALQASFLCGARRRTVDITTENDQLAKDGLEKFSAFYDRLGIPHGDNVITAQSAYGQYVANGVNYSTASNLSLFRKRMAIAKKLMPNNPALIADEIDATLTSTVHFRLAATLDPALNDPKSWEAVYQLILEFVKEEQIYRNNPCSCADDVSNLRNYFIAKNPQRMFQFFTSKISNELLGTLIESAMVAHELEEDVDFYVVKIKEKEGYKYYAAPIIASTKRPDPSVSYSDYGQQLVHTLLNNRKPAPKYPFTIDPSTETIVVDSPKNFFDYYRLLGGPIIGLTGTAGSYVERAEFFQQQGLVAFNYPTYHSDLSQNLGLIGAFGHEDHLQNTFEFLKQRKLENPAQPVLLITSSPQATEQFRDFIAKNTNWKLQSYHGFEEGGKSEENVIYTAGKEYFLTTANQSLARGADVDPEHVDGLLVVNLCTDLTESDLLQIQGRAARNGKPGQYISIIDAQNIAAPEDSAEALAAAFQQHQHNISVQQQKERAKMRLLEETRFLLTNRVLKLRAEADRILAPQLGEESSIIENKELLSRLSSLNRRAEKHYAELLEKHQQVEGLVAQEYLEARVNDYQELLTAWLPENKFEQMQFVEPSIPLAVLSDLAPKLQEIRVDELRTFADIFHRKWSLDGHQKTEQNLQKIDELVAVFDPYFKEERSFKQTLGQALDERGLLKAEIVNAQVAMIKTNVDEMLEYAKTITIIGRLVPEETIRTYAASYIDTTATQIREKKWDDIKPPTLDITSISNWFSGVSRALTVGSLLLGGPIPFIVNRLVVPTVIEWVKNSIKRRFANSESIVAQLLIGLDDIGADSSAAITALTSLSAEQDVDVGLLVDKLGSLAKNKALLLAVSKYFELMEMPQYIPWVQAIPDVLSFLEAYRDHKPHELLKVETLMAFFQHAANSELLLQALEDSPYLPSLQHLATLNPEFMTKVSTLSFPEFMSLLKLSAHPNFFAMLEKLPADTTFAQLRQWLDQASPELSAQELSPQELSIDSQDSQQAISDMLTYNTNRERLAQENKQQLLNLRNVHQLSYDKLSADLAKLKPTHKTAEATPTVVEVKPQFALAFQQAILVALTSAFIAYSVIFLSLAATLASLAIASWMTFPWLFKLLPEKKVDLKPTKGVLPLKQVLSFILGGDTLTTAKEQEASPIEQEVLPSKAISVEAIERLREPHHRFFAPRKREPLTARIDTILQQMETPQAVH